MSLNRDEEIARLRNELRRIGIIQWPGLLLAAFGIYGKFLGTNQPFAPLLDDPRVTTGMLVVGGIILAWTWVRAIPIFRRIAKLERGLTP